MSFLVFVVDDEPVIASTLASILKLNGYDTRSFVNPMEALDAARTYPPDLLVSDVVMPKLSGIDLGIRMREQCPNCKVLLFSGQAATRDMLAAARLQGHDFTLLSKPVHPDDLLARIKDIMKQLSDWQSFDPTDRKTYPKMDAPVQVRFDNGQTEEGNTRMFFPLTRLLPSSSINAWRYIRGVID